MLRSSLSLRLLLGVFLLTAIGVVSPAPTDPGGIPHVPGEVIIKFKANVTEQEKDQIRAELGGSEIRGLGRIKAELRRLGTLSVEDAVTQYRNHPKIEYIEPNYIVEADEIPNDPRFNELWGMLNTGQTGGTAGADISATNAWDVFTGSDQVLIGVIDTGVDYTHPDLAANIYTNPGEIPNNGIDDDNNGFIDDVHGWDFYNDDNDPMDDHGHGSHVSGTIGAIGNNGIGVAGVCWNVKIVPLKFLSSGGSGSTADAVDAVNYATALGVNLTSNSWGGGGYSQALYDAISAANAAGQLFVAASGNSGANTDTSPHYPSAYDLPNIVAVAATDHNDQLASFSNYGVNTVDLAAPGVDILSTFPGNTYGSISGTSMATPHVSGALGLVFGRFPSIGHLDAKNLLLNFVDPLPNLNGVVLTGGRLNAFFPIAEPDSIPPGPVTDLTVTDAGSNWLIAGWSATGDDGMTGTASRYVVKYSTSPIDASNFDMAMTAPNPPDPGPPGTAESMKIAGLDFDTTYYVAVKVLDEFGNASDISNVASGTTLGIPDIAGSPLSFTETLLTGATSTQMLTLSNVGFGTLDWTAPAPQLIVNPPAINEYVELAKDQVDARPGVLGTGGPDGFGYRWTDSDDPTGPAFNWTDISGTGTLAMSTGDDVNNGPHPIGFTFSFYGVDYTTFRVCSNGWLSFNSTSTAYGNQPLPNSGAPTALVAPFWDDLNLSTSGEVYYQSDGSRLIVQWNNVAHYSSGGPYTFQAILENDGTILYQYLTMGSPTNSCTIGIQNAAQTDGLQVVYNTAYLHDNMAIRLAAVPQWVTVSPSSGTIYAPNSTMLSVDFDAAGLLGGVYDGNILIFSNDPDENPFTIPVQMTVIGAPDIELAPTAIDFGPVFIGATPTDVLHVQNPGTDVLTVSSVTVDDAVYTLNPTAFTVPPKSSVDVTITFAPTMVASHPATVTVQSDDPDEPTVTMSLMGSGVVPPAFAVAPTELNSNLYTGETETQHLMLSNSGGADLEWSAGVEFLAPSQLFTLTTPEVPVGADADGGVVEGPTRTTPIQVELNDLTGIDILWDRSHGQTSTTSWTTIIADFESRGATVTVNTDPLTPALLANYDVLWSVDTGTSDVFDPAELAALSDWINAGGGLLLEGDNASSVADYNDILTALGAGITFSTTSGASGTTSNIYPHPTTENVTGVYFTANVASIPSIVSPAEPVVDDVDGVGAAAASQVGAGHIFAVSDEVFQNSRMSQADNQLFGNQVMDWLAGNNFLTVDPTSGTVSPGGSQDLSVLFDATGMFGGFYEANIVLTTNDPLALEVLVPAALQVTGAPDLSLDPTSIDFGQVYVGYPDLHGFQIFNAGTDVLTISSVTSDNPAFSVFLGGDTFPIQLAAQTSTVLQARFAPPAVGPFSGTLTIHSDDPDTPEALLAVSGEGLLPPVASVNPTSLHADLLTGETETQQVTISNAGATDLDWSTQLQFQLPTQLVTLTTPESPSSTADEDGGIVDGPARTTPIQVELADLTGVAIMWDRAHGQTSTSLWTTIIADFESRGATVTENTDPFTPALLQNYNVIWSVDTGTSATFEPAELAALSDWIHAGGALMLEGDNASSVADYNDILTALGAGIEFSTTSGASGTTNNIYPHTTTRNVTGVYFTANVASIPTIASPGFPLVDDVNGVGAAAGSRVGGGRIFAVSDEIFQNSRMSQADNQLFGNQVMDWLATPVFLSLDPSSGIVSPGGSTVVDVSFDAGGLFGGNYAANVRVLSNDPANGAIDIAATMTVTGVPRIGFDPAMVDMGEVYIGYPESQILTVSNIGTDLLSVTSTAFGLPDFSVDLPAFDLNPGESRDVMVTLNPVVVGDRSTMITFTSNDPDSPHMVPVSGTSLVPPVAGVNPTSLHADLLTGETETQMVTLSNTGGSDLAWSTHLEFQAPTQLYTLTTPEMPSGADADGGIVDGPARTTPIQAEVMDLNGVHIMWDRAHGQTSTSLWSTIIADFEARGATVTENTDPYTPALLLGYDVIWSADTGTSDVFEPAELAALSDWINAGGALLLEGDNASSVADYNDVLTALGAGITFSTTSGASGTTTNIYPHPTTQNVTGVYFTANVASIPTIVNPAVPVVDDVDGVGAAAASQVGAGRIFAVSDEIFQNSRMSQADNQLFGNQVMGWLATPAFLSVDPESGIVPPGSSTQLNVTFDATGLFGGDYSGALHVVSNDPTNGSLEVMATMHVTGAPVMAYEPTSMDFGDVFIGYPATISMTITNVGTDLLSMSSMSFGLPDYSVDVGSFDLNPFESQEVMVTFDPQSAGDRSTQLTMTANDAASPHMMPIAGVGLVPPVIGVSPDPVVGAALPGGSKTKTLTICNTGGSDLVFDVLETQQATSVTVYDELTLPKQADEEGSQESVDPRPSILGTGGPDLFGYTWIDSDEPGGPAYDWTDISGVGTPVPFASYVDDGTVGPVPIGFNFPFYDGSFSEVYVCSNGWLSFTNSSLHTYTNQPLPNSGSSTPENMLAPWWDDMVYDESDGNNAFYYNDGSRFIIQFYVRRIAAFTPPFYLFQVILYPNGNIVYQYHTLGTTLNSSTIGIQNGTKDDGLTVVHNDGSYAHEELAILFSAGPDWLSVSPTSGVVPAGECMDLAVTMDAAELEAGDYFGAITVNSNDPANPMVSADVVFHVGSIDAADCDADPNTLNLGANGSFVTTYAELPMGYAPEDVVLETVRLNGVVPADRLSIEDFNENGIPDLTFKFDRSAVAAILAEGDSVEITVTGEIRDTTYFVCTNYIRVIRPAMMHPNGGEVLIAGGTAEISWANPDGWDVTSASLTWSSDGGQTWNLIAEGITGTSYTWQVPAELTAEALIRVHVYDAIGMLGFDTSDEVFSIGESVTDTGDRLPTEYTLSSVSGNPVVGGNAVIQLALPQDGNVNVRIYDVRGALVRELVTNQPMPAGRHYVEWDRTNRSGVLVSSGIYFVRAQTGGKDLKMRVTVLR